MAFRTIGQEIEYAIRFSASGGAHPGNVKLYQAIKAGIQRQVRFCPGQRPDCQDQFFTENGGAFLYEFKAIAPEGGLLEGATPECLGPAELLCYQRAQEAILVRALRLARKKLAAEGVHGDLALIKNCRDAEGHKYGAQENYEADLATGWALRCCQLGATIAVPGFIVFYGVWWCALAAVLLCALACLIAYGLFRATLTLLDWLTRHILLEDVVWFFRLAERRAFKNMSEARFWNGVDGFCSRWYQSGMLQIALPYLLPLRWFAFKKQRRALETFFISRTILTGAGTVLANGDFALSERAAAVRQLTGPLESPTDGVLYDFGNLVKTLVLGSCDLFCFRGVAIRSLFRRRQRFQIGMSDSNRCQVAEYLKFGTGLLALEMADAGFLENAPRLESPLAALQAIIRDPTLTTRVAVRGRSPMTAIELQRFYLEAAGDFLIASKAVPDELYGIVALWEETLEALENHPTALIGRIDWVTKHYLIETAGAGAPMQVKKKIDLRYHELGGGYYDLLERAGLAPCLVSPAEIQKAILVPSSSRGAQRRSRWIGDADAQAKGIAMCWNSVRIGAWWHRKTISS